MLVRFSTLLESEPTPDGVRVLVRKDGVKLSARQGTQLCQIELTPAAARDLGVLLISGARDAERLP